VDTDIPKNLDELVQTVKYFGKLSQDFRSNAANYPLLHEYVRRWISDMKCFTMISAIIIESNILVILHEFFDWVITNGISGRRVPLDIRLDLEWLKRKWQRGDWNLSDCLRGINVDQYRLSRSLDKDWPFYKPNWRQFGNNRLISGETWPNQIAIMRDGGHGATEAGISGIRGMGATSIVLSDPENRVDYADVDRGDEVYYVSTASRNTEPTKCTELLLASYEWFVLKKEDKIKQEDEDEEKEADPYPDRPVRVFRSWRLSEKNKLRPQSGFRYDGLYDVTDGELIDAARALYRFCLKRRENQGDIRADQPDDQTCLLYYQARGVQRAASKRKYAAYSTT
jgi:SAD/SRA domain